MHRAISRRLHTAGIGGIGGIMTLRGAWGSTSTTGRTAAVMFPGSRS
jgi:hypothetical protein